MPVFISADTQCSNTGRSNCKYPSTDLYCPFTCVSSQMFIMKDTISEIMWRFLNEGHQDWEVQILTKEFTLNDEHERTLVSEGHDFNLTIHNIGELNETVVTVSLLFNDIVLENVPYISCKLFRNSNPMVEYGSVDVKFNTYATTELTISHQTTTMQTNVGIRPYLSLILLFLSTFVSLCLCIKAT